MNSTLFFILFVIGLLAFDLWRKRFIIKYMIDLYYKQCQVWAGVKDKNEK